MGAYTAVKLTKFYEVGKLVLIVPAIYDSTAYMVPFKEGFTQIIRYPRSWVRSDAWSLLAGYNGDLMIVGAENDEVIPAGVIEKLYASAINCRRRKIYVAHGVSHLIFTQLRTRNAEEYERIMGMIVEILK